MDLDESEILAGCSEEISDNGKYWIECQIICGYVTSLYAENTDEKHSDLMKDLGQDKKTPQHLRYQLMLFYSAMAMGTFAAHLMDGELSDAEDTYNATHRMLCKLELTSDIEKHTIYVIKAGVSQSIALVGQNATPAIAAQILSDLKTCCQLMPNYYEANYQYFFVQMRNATTNGQLKALKKVCDRFPNGVSMHGAYILKLGREQNNMDKAIRELNAFRRNNPDEVHRTWGIQGMLHEGQPISVKFFKRAILNIPHEGTNYLCLGKYFAKVTHEYAKALEILTQGIAKTSSEHCLRSMFELRHDLLTKIVAQKYWDQL